MKIQKIAGFAASVVALFALSTAAQALSLTPASPGVIGRNLGPSNCEPGCVYTTFGLTNDGSLNLLYKADVGDFDRPATIESGSFAGSYNTVFANSAFDPEDATITFTGGAAISCGVCYLVIKDGNQQPSYYFFDLTAAGWNGTDAIMLTDFWVGRGAISHVAIWGSSERSVPEPGTLGLLGLGLAGMAAGMRRRRKLH
jgi:hypothetical protein